MVRKEQLRPGGRSARVQASVHEAVRALLARHDRAEITFPLIAAEAGVTPSTLYRRWGELPELLADVAVERLRPDTPPADTGSLRGDLEAWAEQIADEYASTPGRAMLRDVLAANASGDQAYQCCTYLREALDTLTLRAHLRGERSPGTEALIDGVMAPIAYRILFLGARPDEAHVKALVSKALHGLA